MVAGTLKQVIFKKNLLPESYGTRWVLGRASTLSFILLFGQSRYQEVYLWIRQGFVLGNHHILKSSVCVVNKTHLF